MEQQKSVSVSVCLWVAQKSDESKQVNWLVFLGELDM